jgi:serine/threonine-protein kinase SRK2
MQTEEEIMRIVSEARNPSPASTTVAGFRWGTQGSESKKEDKQEEEEVEEEEEEEEEDEDVYDKTVKQVHASGEFHLN